MKEKLIKLLENAYCPISNFPVSSIIVMNDGTQICGVNVEDASTRAGICAERNAITTAISMGYKKGDFKEIHVMVNNLEPSECCFVCRQLIVEFFSPNDLIYCYGNTGKMKVYTVAELCPYPFNEEDLK